MSAWQESNPEGQGMDAALLAQANDYLAEKLPTVQALAIVRHGCLVFERHNAHPQLDPASAAWKGLLSAAGARQAKDPGHP